jgi:hypothetical protein
LKFLSKNELFEIAVNGYPEETVVDIFRIQGFEVIFEETRGFFLYSSTFHF